jgi:hypothetical protein
MATNFVSLEKHFTDLQLQTILEQAAIYSCACPAQVCQSIIQQRTLFNYQATCYNGTDTDRAVHSRIADSVRQTHAEMERCLEDILRLEGWDMDSLKMPTNMAKRLTDDVIKG